MDLKKGSEDMDEVANAAELIRRPVYCATDYHYIRFNTGRGEWQWESWNGHIRPFWD